MLTVAMADDNTIHYVRGRIRGCCFVQFARWRHCGQSVLCQLPC